MLVAQGWIPFLNQHNGFGVFEQLIPEIRMSDVNQGQCPLAGRFTTKIHAAVLGDYIFHIHSGVRGHLNLGNDRGDGSIFGR